MRRHLSGLLLVLVLLAGVGVILYPTVGDWLNTRRMSRVLTDYHRAAAQADAEDYAEWFAGAEAYNEALRQKPYALYVPSAVEGYDEALQITTNGIMGYISIGKIGVRLPIYHGADEETLKKGVGHLPGTSLPTGGPGTHCVLLGHSGEPGAKFFTDLEKLKVGDAFVLTVLDREMTYRVDQIRVVLPTEYEELEIRAGEDFCTLVTCTPYGINTHRLLVRGARVENEAAPEPFIIGEDARQIDPFLLTCAAAALAVTVAVLLLLQLGRRRRPTARSKKGPDTRQGDAKS